MADRAKPEPTEVKGVYTRDILNPKTKKPDTCFDISYKEKVDGVWKNRWERAVGWKSERCTAEKAGRIRIKRLNEMEEGKATPATQNALEKAAGTIGAYFTDTVMVFQKANNKTWAKCEERYNKHIEPVFGKLRFSQVTPGMINEWRDKLLAEGKVTKEGDQEKRVGLSEGMVGILLNILHQIFRIAETNGVIQKNPFNETVLNGRGKTVNKIRIPKPKNNNRERALTREEANTLMTAAFKWRDQAHSSGWGKGNNQGDPDMPDMILLAIKQGLRAKEVASLQVKDVVFEFNHIMLWDQKSGRKQPFKIAKAVEEMFRKKWEGKDPSPQAYVFPRPKSGKIRDTGSIDRVFAKIVATTELNKGREHDPYQLVTFHTLRHTFGTWLAMAGKDIKTIMKMMRHSDIKDTLRYLNFASTYVDQVTDELDSSWVAPLAFEVDSESLPANVIPMPLKR